MQRQTRDDRAHGNAQSLPMCRGRRNFIWLARLLGGLTVRDFVNRGGRLSLQYRHLF